MESESAERTEIAADRAAARTAMVVGEEARVAASVLEHQDVRAVAMAGQDAVNLQAQREGDAAVLKAAGLLDADALRVAGQRAINLIWEQTQKRLAQSVIFAALIVAGGLAVFGKWLGSPDLQLAAVVFLFGVANLVTGFYFGRTNHQRTGGVGVPDTGSR